MRKYGILSLIAGVLIFIVAIVTCLPWLAIHNFPPKAPYLFNLACVLSLLVIIVGAVILCISDRNFIINEIKKLYKKP